MHQKNPLPFVILRYRNRTRHPSHPPVLATDLETHISKLRSAMHNTGRPCRGISQQKMKKEHCKLQQLKLMRWEGNQERISAELRVESPWLSVQNCRGPVRHNGRQIFQTGIIFLETEPNQNMRKGNQEGKGMRGENREKMQPNKPRKVGALKRLK